MALRAPILSKQFLKKLDSTLFFFFSKAGLLGRAAAGLSRIGDAPRIPKIRENDQNRVKNEKFLTFQNGPKWIKVTFKWSKMAPKRIFG